VLLVGLGGAALAAWAWLALGQGRFWVGDQRLDGTDPEPAAWPDVVAVVPARDEAAVIGRAVASLVAQDYPGRLRVVVADDESGDGTGDLARAAAAAAGRAERLTVVRTPARPPGWVGKMWAVHTGIAEAGDGPAWLLLTDADVEHGPRSLRRLVAAGEARALHLVSHMVLLHCRSVWERLLVPAFVYFFMQLYPFPWVNDPRSRVAGAAGGCMLVRREALARAGGIAAIRGEIIDDCALGRALKAQGPIWLGLTTTERSIRPYDGLRDVWDMVARSAYTQLRHSPAILAGTLAGLLLLYVVPVALVLLGPWHGDVAGAALGAGTWLLMATTYVPTLLLYGRSPLLAFALPVAGTLYAAMTFDSARRHWRGQGATWKGRAGAGDAASATGG
jgi:hopene-associated glycosyltransferase HpnB